ncbi:hypothetical protein [Planomonospora parontospora]|uniref:hypothetical protein n=1 Tax=Planomonospora parontospora TaxID=58119 RepID=UPI001670BAA3|nr:hypothetical protein [Planomonospora parontospora]GGL32237.1 hypothetical protein GCM10014719_36930 [Planomonospora parontospora subsp. antibiotica]GII16912.1 hypothetical protein Ppa05_36380 [Planomonospora parontospora subsp. antibiotica]
MNFEETLLMELKEEIGARAVRARSRSRLRRRLLVGAGATGIAAALIIVPTVTGTENPAYAVARQADGSITVKINEFRDPELLERDLAALGVRAEVRYSPPGKTCSRDFAGADPKIPWKELTSTDPKVKAEVRRKLDGSPSARAFDLERGGSIRIFPDRIGREQTAVMEVAENSDQTSGPEKPRTLWSFSFELANGPVGECVLEDLPGWNDIGDPEKNPEAFPPAGS